MFSGKILVPLFLLLGISFVAQAQQAGIVGTITDQSGAVVSQGVVTAKDLATGASHQATTNDVGQYTISDLGVGVYQVVIEKTGFRRGIVDQVRLEVQLITRVDFTLQVGQLAEEVR